MVMYVHASDPSEQKRAVLSTLFDSEEPSDAPFNLNQEPSHASRLEAVIPSSNANPEFSRMPPKLYMIDRRKNVKPSTVHAEAQSGDIRALKIRLLESPNSINMRNHVVRFSVLYLPVNLCLFISLDPFASFSVPTILLFKISVPISVFSSFTIYYQLFDFLILN
jgi:hypothetical protein